MPALHFFAIRRLTAAVTVCMLPGIHAPQVMAALSLPARIANVIVVSPPCAAIDPGVQLDPDSTAQREGINAYNRGDYDKAIACFLALLKTAPKFADVSYNLGLTYEAKKDYKNVIACFTRVIEAKPKLADTFVERGRCYAASGDFDNAMKDFSHALELNPEPSDSSMARGNAYALMNKWDLALADYAKYLALAPMPDPIVYYDLAAANYACGRYDAAIDNFKKFEAKADPIVLSYTDDVLGDAYAAKQDFPNAIAAYTKRITLNATDPSGRALKGRAWAYVKSKKYALALQDFDHYLKLHPEDKEAQSDRAAAAAAASSVQ